jgi:site-specific DNA-cytosine methylase
MIAYYNDIDQFCCNLLRAHIQLGNLPKGFVDGRDIRELHATDFADYQHIHLFAGIGGFPLGLQYANFPEHIRLLTGGFPCQDISIAGRQAGIIDGERSGLWGEMVRLIREAQENSQPFEYIIIENVRNLLSGGDWLEEETEEEQIIEARQVDALRSTEEQPVGDNADVDVFRSWMGVVLADLAQVGYDAEWGVFRASDIGAPHSRERIFIVAYPNSARCETPRTEQQTTPSFQRSADVSYSNSDRQWIGQDQQERQPQCQTEAHIGDDGTKGIVEHASSSGCTECDTPTVTRDARHITGRSYSSGDARTPEPGMGRVFDGLSTRLDRFRWPAGPDQQPHDWEPSRTVNRKQPHRPARLKALGNAIVPQIPMLIGLMVAKHYHDTHMPVDTSH